MFNHTYYMVKSQRVKYNVQPYALYGEIQRVKFNVQPYALYGEISKG